jgi:outer membrane protein OmpA-like peptidoglycan-associated protein
VGYPINTFADEIGLFVNARGDKGFFASNRNLQYKKDIFEINMPVAVRPAMVSYVKGQVFNADTHQPLDALLELVDLETQQVVHRSYSQKNTGEFLVCIPTNRQFAFNISRENYLFHSEHFSVADSNASYPVLKNFALEPIRIGKKTVLNNIFFETNSYELKKTSEVELNKLVQFLKTYPQLRIEIMGHTDNVGNEKFNLTLSENRAKAVAQYLIRQGIDPKRIQARGYGEKHPVASNDTDEGRALNRRTEFKIIE